MRLQINKLRKRERKKRRAGCALQQQTTQRFNQHPFFSHPRRTFTSTKSTNLCTSNLHRRFQPSSTLLSLTRLSHPLGVPRDNPYPETSLASCLVVAAVFFCATMVVDINAAIKRRDAAIRYRSGRRDAWPSLHDLSTTTL